MRVAINGFGRIGRSVYRILDEDPNIDVVAINDLYDNDVLAYLLKYDTVMSKFYAEARVEGDYLVTPREKVLMLSQSDMAQLPWKELDIDVVVEATSVFRKKSQLEAHLSAGARRVS